MGKLAVGAAAAVSAAVAAALVVRHRMKNSGKWGRVLSVVREFEERCGTPIVKLRQVADAMDVEMHAGLASEGGSKLKMLITFVDNLPTGLLLIGYMFIQEEFVTFYYMAFVRRFRVVFRLYNIHHDLE